MDLNLLKPFILVTFLKHSQFASVYSFIALLYMFLRDITRRASRPDSGEELGQVSGPCPKWRIWHGYGLHMWSLRNGRVFYFVRSINADENLTVELKKESRPIYFEKQGYRWNMPGRPQLACARWSSDRVCVLRGCCFVLFSKPLGLTRNQNWGDKWGSVLFESGCVVPGKKAISLDHHSQRKLIKSDGARERDQNVKSGFFSSQSLTAVKLKMC